MKHIVEFLNEAVNSTPAWYNKGIATFASQLKSGLGNLNTEMKPYKAILEAYVKFFVEQLPENMAEDSYLKDKDNLWDFMHEDFYDNFIFDNDVADEDLYEQFENEKIWEKYYKSITKKEWFLK